MEQIKVSDENGVSVRKRAVTIGAKIRGENERDRNPGDVRTKLLQGAMINRKITTK